MHSEQFLKMTSETILIGRDLDISSMPRESWEEDLAASPVRIRKRLNFMSSEHHLVRNYVVRELPRLGRPIRAVEISQAIGLTPLRTDEILAELEAHLFFLVRGQDGDVAWAFPVTVEKTGHHLLFDTDERLDAA